MILVAGATGSLGSKIVRGLLGQGDSVRALVRPGSNYRGLRDAGAEIVFGDLKSPDSLVDACQGISAVVSTASATNRSDDIPGNVDGQGTKNLIAAARADGVQHFVFISTIAASPESPVPAFRAKGEAENYLERSGVGYTIIRAAAFMDVLLGMLFDYPLAAGRPITLVGESRRRHSFIAERDVAAFVLAALRNPSARNARLIIGGPQPVTFDDIVAAYEAALGRSIAVQRVTPGEPIPGLPEPAWRMAAALETFDSIIPMEEPAQRFGVQLTSVEEFARSRVPDCLPYTPT